MDRVQCHNTVEAQWGDSLLSTNKFVVVTGPHLINLEEWKAESTREPPSGFELKTNGSVIRRAG